MAFNGFNWGSGSFSSTASSSSALKRQRDEASFDRIGSVPKKVAGSSFASSSLSHSADFSSRGLYKPRRSKTEELTRQLAALNKHFSAFIEQQHRENPGEDWTAGVRDYLSYLSQLKETFVPQSGKVFTFGSGDCGQLGHGVEEESDLSVRYPRVVRSLYAVNFVKISCGGLHTVALTAEGQVYSWGCNDDGALGRTMKESAEENIPTLVSGFPNNPLIVDVVAGDCHSTVLSVEGDVYGWGCYKDKDGKNWFHDQESSKSFKKKQLTPMLIRGVTNAVEIKCGASFTVARTADGALWSWGLGEMGQLGRPVIKEFKDSEHEYLVADIIRDHLTPARVQLDRKPVANVKVVGCGAYHTLFSMAIGNRTFAVGLNNYGQLGLGDTDARWEPVRVSALDPYKLIRIAGGVHHSMVLTWEGKVLTFGRSDSGQLGDGSTGGPGSFTDRPQLIKIGDDNEPIVAISCGANHNMVLSKSQTVYAWGYGDMYALGTGKDKDEVRPAKLRWDKVAVDNDKQVLQVEAGGQHSAIIIKGKISVN